MDIGVLGPVARSAADLDLCLKVLVGLDPVESAAWRLELPAAPARAIGRWRAAVWPEEPGWLVDRIVAERLAAVADALAEAGMKVDEVRPVDLEESLDVAQRLIQGGIAGFLPDPDYAALAGWAGWTRRTSHRPPASRGTSPSRYGTWPGPSSSSTGCGPAGCGSSPSTTSSCARSCAPRPSPTDHNPDVDARVITANGRPVPYADQFAWVQAVGVAYLPTAVAPAGIAADGLPVGIQVVGPYLHDHTVTAFARALADLIGGFMPPPVYAAPAA